MEEPLQTPLELAVPFPDVQDIDLEFVWSRSQHPLIGGPIFESAEACQQLIFVNQIAERVNEDSGVSGAVDA